MNTTGRLHKYDNGGNYRLDRTKSSIEAATDFALEGSVFNEVIHTAAMVGAAPSAALAISDIAEGRYGGGFYTNLIGVGLNLGLNGPLVALQRYNRARMVKRVDEELQEGKTFGRGYRNKFGIDARAVNNLQEAPQQDLGDTGLTNQGNTLLSD